MERRARSDTELKPVVRDIAYEIRMLRRGARVWDPKLADDFAGMVLIEVVLLHARSLRDFFYPGREFLNTVPEPREDDVIAVDFFEAPDRHGWFAQRPVLGSMAVPLRALIDDRNERRRLDRRLAHLSYSRAHTKEAWALGLIAAGFEPVIAAFLGALAPHRRAWFDAEPQEPPLQNLPQYYAFSHASFQ